MKQLPSRATEVKSGGRTFGEVVREYFPKATDEEVDFILWGKTGFPCFWETADTEACLRQQLIEFKAEVETSKKPSPCQSKKEEVKDGQD